MLPKCVERIADFLTINSCHVTDVGLGNGKSGMAIFFYYLYRNTKADIYKGIADMMLQELYEDINYKVPVHLEDGLMGVSLGLSHLMGNFTVGDEIAAGLIEKIDSLILSEFTTEPTDEFLDKCLYLHFRKSHLVSLKTFCWRKIETVIIEYFEIDFLSRSISVASPVDLIKTLLVAIKWKIYANPHMSRPLKEISALLIENLQKTHSSHQSFLTVNTLQVFDHLIGNTACFKNCRSIPLGKSPSLSAFELYLLSIDDTFKMFIYDTHTFIDENERHSILTDQQSNELLDSIINQNTVCWGLRGLSGIGLSFIKQNND